jgi:glycosyltransferase involved in cell wall biosynthesis
LEGPLVTFKLLKCLRREQPHIVQTHELKANLYGRIAARWARVPVIIGTLWTLKDTAPSPLRRLRDRILQPLSAWLDHRSDRVLACSDAIRREWDPSLQSPLYQTIYLPLALERPVKETNFPDALSDAAILKLGSVARLSEEKGLAILLEALPAILTRLPNAMLFIAGDGKMRSALEDLAARLGVSLSSSFSWPRGRCAGVLVSARSLRATVAQRVARGRDHGGARVRLAGRRHGCRRYP